METLRESLYFIRNDKGRAEAEQGKHDDRIMSLAIAHYIRSQQDMAIMKKEMQKNYFYLYGYMQMGLQH